MSKSSSGACSVPSVCGVCILIYLILFLLIAGYDILVKGTAVARPLVM